MNYNNNSLEGFRKRVTVMNSRINTLIVNPRILYEVKTYTGEILNSHGSSSNMSISRKPFFPVQVVKHLIFTEIL